MASAARALSEASREGCPLAAPMKTTLLVALAAALALAGCTAQVDSAKQQIEQAKVQIEEAKAALAEAKEEAAQAKDRFDRVRSLTALREERLNIVVSAEFVGTDLTFRLVSAVRSNGEMIPPAYVSRLPLLALETDAANGTAVLCDPLTCQVYFPEGRTLAAYWKDDADRVYSITRPACPDPATCGAPEIELTLADAKVLATTSVGDADA